MLLILSASQNYVLFCQLLIFQQNITEYSCNEQLCVREELQSYVTFQWTFFDISEESESQEDYFKLWNYYVKDKTKAQIYLWENIIAAWPYMWLQIKSSLEKLFRVLFPATRYAFEWIIP